MHTNHSSPDVNRKSTCPSHKLLDPIEVAEALGVSPKTLARWRCEQTGGPRWVKIGRLVRYRAADVDAYVESRVRGGGHDGH